MEKDIGKIKKSENTDIVVRIDDFGGKRGLTIREFVRGERYTGFTKSGTRISAENFSEFKELINSIDEKDLQAGKEEKKIEEKQAEKKEQKTLEVKEEKPKRGRKKKGETSESKRTGLANEEEEAKPSKFNEQAGLVSKETLEETTEEKEAEEEEEEF